MKNRGASASSKTSAATSPRSTSRSATASAGRSTAPSPSSGAVHADHQRRTCIELQRTPTEVLYVDINTEDGLDVTTTDHETFGRRFKPLADYPVDRAARLYVEYARGIGASERVMRLLGQFTNVTNEDIEMATKKKAARAAATVKPASKPAAPKKDPAKKPAKPEAAQAAPKAAKAPAEKRDRGPTAAARFQELIMEGKKTDDQIFEVVKKEFNLDDSKKSYVKWYRNYLAKQGKNPPAAKE